MGREQVGQEPAKLDRLAVGEKVDLAGLAALGRARGVSTSVGGVARLVALTRCLDNLTALFQPVQVLDAGSRLPLYHQLADQLFAQIRQGTYVPGSKIPSEHELAAQHGIGRPTVRQATDALIQRGVLERRRGSGTYVRSVPAQVDLFSLAGTLVSFERGGLALTSRLLGRPRVIAIDEPGHPHDGAKTCRVIRLSLVDDAPVLLEEIDLAVAHFPGLARLPLHGRSLSELVAERYQMHAQGADQRFRVTALDRARARHLGLPAGAPILHVERTLQFARAEAAVFAKMFCRTDRLVFSQRLQGNSHA
jgi:GntR family transcriptional regulator